MPFTFKKDKPETGLASVGAPYPGTMVKYRKKEVGRICPPDWRVENSKWRIRLLVIKEDEPCGWVWKTLKKQCESEPEARKFLNDNFDAIFGLGLYEMEIEPE